MIYNLIDEPYFGDALIDYIEKMTSNIDFVDPKLGRISSHSIYLDPVKITHRVFILSCLGVGTFHKISTQQAEVAVDYLKRPFDKPLVDCLVSQVYLSKIENIAEPKGINIAEFLSNAELIREKPESLLICEEEFKKEGDLSYLFIHLLPTELVERLKNSENPFYIAYKDHFDRVRESKLNSK